MIYLFLILIEISVILLALFTFLRNRFYSISESISLSIALLFSILSFVYQSVFLIHSPKLAFIIELCIIIYCLYRIRFEIDLIRNTYIAVGCFLKRNKIVIALLPLLCYLFFLSILIPPYNNDSLRHHLGRVLLFQQSSSLFLDIITPFESYRAVYPSGSDILSHAFLRFHSDYGIGLFSYLAYI